MDRGEVTEDIMKLNHYEAERLQLAMRIVRWLDRIFRRR